MKTWLLLAYFGLYFLVGFLLRSWLVFRRTGQKPLVLPKSDDAGGYVGRAFKIVMLTLPLPMLMAIVAPNTVPYFAPLSYLGLRVLEIVGAAILALSFLILLVAQAQMGISWRIGIDEGKSTPLVRRGLFSVSRNPIFLSMRLSLLGLLLAWPTALNLLFLVVAEILIQVQVRLEEQHLLKIHGEEYRRYQAAVRRWL